MLPSSAYYRHYAPYAAADHIPTPAARAREYTYERIGAPVPQPPAPAPDASIVDHVAQGITTGIKQITPTLIVVAVVTGASFAVGAFLAHRFILPAGAHVARATGSGGSRGSIFSK